MAGGNGFVLRPSQMALLDGGQSKTMLIDATTTLSASQTAQNSSTPATPTVTVSATASPPSTTGFSAGAMAGVGVGVGAPFLLALLGALLVISSLKKRLREGTIARESSRTSTEKGKHDSGPYAHLSPGNYQQQQQPYSAQATTASYSPSAFLPSSEAKYYPVSQPKYQSVFREMDPANELREMGTERPRQELDDEAK